MRVCTRLMAAGWHLPEIKVVGGDAAQRAQAAAAIAGGSGSTELLGDFGDFGFVYIRALARIHAILMSNVLTSGLRHFYGFRFWKILT
jgi:hypothetical protein